MRLKCKKIETQRIRLEVDAIVGDARLAIEIKSVEEILPRHLKGLKSFAEDYPAARLIIVSLDPFNRRMGNVECIHVLDFFRQLWKGFYSYQ